MRAHDAHHVIARNGGRLVGRELTQVLSAEVAGHYDERITEVDRAALTKEGKDGGREGEKEDWSEKRFKQRKSTHTHTAHTDAVVLTCESVKRPSSKTCNNRFPTSRCAFSNSSSNRTWYGFRRMDSVRTPPSC
jgi:hypothetical protein